MAGKGKTSRLEALEERLKLYCPLKKVKKNLSPSCERGGAWKVLGETFKLKHTEVGEARAFLEEFGVKLDLRSVRPPLRMASHSSSKECGTQHLALMESRTPLPDHQFYVE